MGLENCCFVNAIRDDEASAFYVKSNIVGLHIQADSQEELPSTCKGIGTRFNFVKSPNLFEIATKNEIKAITLVLSVIYLDANNVLLDSLQCTVNARPTK